MTGKLKEYRVTWVIDLYAGSPREAAELALEIQRDPVSIATIFDVQELHRINSWKKKGNVLKAIDRGER